MKTSSQGIRRGRLQPPKITELQLLLASERAECARLECELELRNCALDTSSIHFMIVDVSKSDWSIVYVNRAICERHGYDTNTLLGQNPTMLVCEEQSAAALGRVREAVRHRTSISIEIVALRKDGATFSVGLNMTPLRVPGQGISHYVCVGADITARIAQERAQRELQEQLYTDMQERECMAIELRLAQKLESVGRLAAGIAHEINTPIQYVGDSVSFLQSAEADLRRLQAEYRHAIGRLVEREPAHEVLPQLEKMENEIDLDFLYEEIPKAFERTLQGVERVAAIVRAMKEFAHPDSAQHDYADINHAIETTLTVAHSEYKYNAQIETQFGDLPLVNCNVGELNQVFLNLIVNAAHAISESGRSADTGRIAIATDAVGAEVTISITDNGCGIPPENVEKVFDPFFTTKPVSRGTGHGLAIARSIVVEKHGGRIEVHSAAGSGTTFTFHLPVKGNSAIQQP
jgi:PAS domain S-box-containing protein